MFFMCFYVKNSFLLSFMYYHVKDKSPNKIKIAFIRKSA
ncbi:hypothetical protein SAMN04488541_1006123 [Thermoflexibacter ruber]|uniref:Uncharacterized protein n=1 Tax=Thermoflexibacter ruber TaxID=1003 RepID=A0A1I2D973_9BACT|nr:hypothetical protein SAMN04488541_1006123 [Thermoflexibacter ruber]